MVQFNFQDFREPEARETLARVKKFGRLSKLHECRRRTLPDAAVSTAEWPKRL